MALPFNARALAGVILGSKSDAAPAKKVVDLCKLRRQAGHPDVNIFKASQALDRYTVAMQRGETLKCRSSVIVRWLTRRASPRPCRRLHHSGDTA
jgi:hypothetical protein